MAESQDISQRAFSGINKYLDDTDISPTESPDCSNCFYHDGKIGSLGQRKGKTFVGTLEYDGALSGVIPYNSQLIMATADGNVQPVDNVPASNYMVMGSTDSIAGTLALDYPNITVTESASFNSDTYDLSLSKYLTIDFRIDGAFTGGSTPSEVITYNLSLSLIIDGVSVHYTDLSFTMEVGVDDGSGNHYPGFISHGRFWIPHGQSGTLSGIDYTLSIDTWPSNSSGGDQVTILMEAIGPVI